MSKKELQRKSIFDLVKLGQLTRLDASKRLYLSYRQTKRAYQRYLKDFYHMAGDYAHNEEFHSVKFILACVKKEVGSSALNPNGTLGKILEVIKEKTQVDYAKLDAETLVAAYSFRANGLTNE